MRTPCVLACLVVPGIAVAGPASYGWLPATALVAEHHAEADGWIYERDDRGHLHERATVLGGAPTFGVTDHLELRIPFELMTRTAIDEPSTTGLSRFGGEGRYRFTPRDAAVAPTARFALIRDVTIRSLVRVELGSAVSFEQGAVHVEGALDFTAEVNRSAVHLELHPGAGASVRVNDTLRLGGELYAEVSLDEMADTWLAIGPDLAMRFGASWLSATFGVGLRGITFAPRINWGFGW